MDWAIAFAPKLILALVLLFIGFWIVKKLMTLFSITLSKAQLSEELKGFLLSLSSIALKLVVILIAASVIGFESSSLIGVLAGVVFAIGLALQGFLGNFASGMTIVFFKPYKVGDWVQISDMFGRVERIEIFNTILITPGDKTLVIPNGQVTDNIITNFSRMGRIRLELSVTMPYAESFPRVKAVIQSALKEVASILQDPEPLIGIASFDSHNVVLSVRPYIHPDDYWQATFECMQRIKAAFNEAHIEVAYSEGIALGKIGD